MDQNSHVHINVIPTISHNNPVSLPQSDSQQSLYLCQIRLSIFPISYPRIHFFWRILHVLVDIHIRVNLHYDRDMSTRLCCSLLGTQRMPKSLDLELLFTLCNCAGSTLSLCTMFPLTGNLIKLPVLEISIS